MGVKISSHGNEEKYLFLAIIQDVPVKRCDQYILTGMTAELGKPMCLPAAPENLLLIGQRFLPTREEGI